MVAGFMVYQRLPVDIYPDISLDEAFISTPYPGASPEDVEHHVTKKIEEELEDIPGVSRIASLSVPNVSNIFVKFREDLDKPDFEAAFQEVRARLDRVTELPQEAEEPLLTRLTLAEVWPIVQVVVSYDGVATERQGRAVALDLKDRLRDVTGIAKIKEVGIREREIHILVDKEKLEEYQLSLTEVAAILTSSNQNIPVGNVQTTGEEYTVRAVGNVADPDELGAIVIKKSPTGAHVFLRDVATVVEDFERQLVMARYLGKPACYLYIAKLREADSISVRNRVEAVLDGYRHRLPPGVEISLFADATQMISSRLTVLKRNLGVGIVLVFVILWMFIGARNSMMAVIGIPFSFLCAFVFMAFIEVSLNAVSVFALVLVSGMIVDDAIVVLENIYRHLQEGKPIKEAVIIGTDEVTWPVISSALTTVAAFLPLLVMTGVVGRFFAIIPKTVTVALLASLFECLIILPAHFMHWGPRKAPGHIGKAITADHLTSLPYRLYRAVLEQILMRRYLAIVVLVALSACAYQARRTLLVELFPSDFPTLVATFNVHPEASLEQTEQACLRITKVLDPFIEKGVLKNHSSAIGMQWNEDNQMRQSSNIAQVWMELDQDVVATIDPELIMDEIRTDMRTYVQGHPDENIENLKVWPLLDGPPVGKPIAIRIEHPNFDVAGKFCRQIKEQLHGIDGIFDISDNFALGQRELQLTINEEAASEFGLTFRDVFNTLGAANEGAIIGTYNDATYDEDLDIRVKYSEEFRSSEDQLLDVDIKTPAGALVKLRQVADVQYDQGYASHFRHDGKRAVVVTANHADHVDADRVVRSVLADLAPLTKGDENLKIVPEGQFKETHESFRSLKSAAAVSILIMYLILAAQFKSYSQPLIILIALVFGTIGLIVGLVLHDYHFSVTTGIALVGLFGIVVNDSIVLVTFINDRLQDGMPLQDALIEGAMVRARPILLTTVTTVCGLLPMALGFGGYNKVWSPFATSICWGLTTATVLILLLIPPLYMVLEEITGRSRRLAEVAPDPQTALCPHE